MMLQIATDEAWRNVAVFDPARKAEVAKAVANLGGILGDGVAWCIVDDSGERQWLEPTACPPPQRHRRPRKGLLVQTCRACGCTDMRACEGGCYWIEPDLCSACAERSA